MNMNKKFILFSLCLFLLTQSTFVYAWHGDGWGRPSYHFHHYGYYRDVLPFAAATLLIAGADYYYWEGEYYRRTADRYIVVPAPVGAVVTTIPAGYQPVVIDGVTYYIVNGVTYMYTPNGYQVVPQPQTIVIQNNDTVAPAPTVVQTVPNVQSTMASSNAMNAFTVNIPNSKGGYTAVVLKRSGAGFIGPQGEYYTEFPRLEQLKVMYAK
jgi:hypothetical protein